VLGYAVRTGQSYGVWGGRPQRELRRLIALDRLGGTQVRTRGGIATPPRTVANTVTASTPPTPTTRRPASGAVASADVLSTAHANGAAGRAAFDGQPVRPPRLGAQDRVLGAEPLQLRPLVTGQTGLLVHGVNPCPPGDEPSSSRSG
jgi:hypothetical protein